MEQLLDNLLNDLSKQVDHAEIYFEQADSTDVEILNEQINNAKDESIKGVGIRVIKDQKQGFAHTTNIDKINETAKQAIKNSKLNNIDENLIMVEGYDKYPTIDGLYDKQLEDYDLTDAIEYSNYLIDLTNQTGCMPTGGGVGIAHDKTIIKNTNGIFVTESVTSSFASIEVNVEDGDVVSGAYSFDVSHFNDINAEEIVEEATELALNSRNGQKTQTRDTSVILDYRATRSLLGVFFSALSSENTQRGRSYFNGKKDTLVATEEFTLTDDGTIPGALASSISDDEGTPSQKTILIEDGILKNFVYDAYRANKDEEDVTTTANATRSYNSIPSVGFSNLKLDFKEILPIDDITSGVLVTNVMGAHTANPITGDFSVEAVNAFEIKNGQRSTPIKNAMISGNIFEIMKNSKAATKETKQLGSCITPKLYVDNLRIIG